MRRLIECLTSYTSSISTGTFPWVRLPYSFPTHPQVIRSHSYPVLLTRLLPFSLSAHTKNPHFSLLSALASMSRSDAGSDSEPRLRFDRRIDDHASDTSPIPACDMKVSMGGKQAAMRYMDGSRRVMTPRIERNSMMYKVPIRIYVGSVEKRLEQLTLSKSFADICRIDVDTEAGAAADEASKEPN